MRTKGGEGRTASITPTLVELSVLTVFPICTTVMKGFSRMLVVRRNATRYLLLSLFVVAPLCSHAADLQTDAYNDYNGTIAGKYAIYMTLYPFSDGTIKGHYFYIKHNEKIRIVGSYSSNKVHLKELNKKGKVTATFDGVLGSTKHEDIFDGTWKQNDTKRVLPFHLVLRQIIGAQWTQRYGDMGGATSPSESEVEDYAAKVKSAILDSKTDWLADNIAYPITLTIRGKEIHIKSRASFIKLAPSALTKKFKMELSELPTMDLYAENSSAAIGNGVIWISDLPNAANGQYEFRITAINN